MKHFLKKSKPSTGRKTVKSSPYFTETILLHRGSLWWTDIFTPILSHPISILTQKERTVHNPHTHFMQFRAYEVPRDEMEPGKWFFPQCRNFPSTFKYTLNNQKYVILYLGFTRCLYVCRKCPCWVTEHLWKRFFSVSYVVDIIV